MKNKLNVIGTILGWNRTSDKNENRPEKAGEVTGKPIDLTSDYVAGRDRIRDAVTRSLTKLVKSRRVAEGKALVIYLEDAYNYQMAISGGLDEYIGNFIEANTDYEFNQYLIRLGKPEVHDVAIHVLPGISMALRMPVSAQVNQSQQPAEHRVFYPAIIDVLKGRGSLKDNKPVELLPENGKIYNIGIGCIEVIRNQNVRYNDIVVDNDENSPMFKYNKYVSRAHAHIVFRTGYGYYLYAEERGTPTYGKRTEISRHHTRPIRLDSPRTGHLLQDGDSIILNGNVILTFKVRKIQTNV